MFSLFSVHAYLTRSTGPRIARYADDYSIDHQYISFGAGGFFRSMNRKIPHALDEHEGNTLGFDEVLIPGARQQVVDQGGDVADVDAAVLVAIGGCQINA